MKKSFILASFYASLAFAGVPIQKDQNNTPLYSAQSNPYVATPASPVTLNTYADIYTLPSTGLDNNRVWKHISVYNPSSTRTVYVCFGGASSCSTDMIQVPPAFGVALDDISVGSFNNITDIWARLDAGGSVTPQVMVW